MRHLFALSLYLATAAWAFGASDPLYQPMQGPEKSRFGVSVASAGDVNGDGYADVIVGASREHRAYLYLGSANGLQTKPAAVLQPDPGQVDPKSGGSFGECVAGVGDVNGDGYDDVVVGDWESGQAYLYFGSKNGLLPKPFLLSRKRGIGSFGYGIASLGDVNGDGLADFAVSSPGSNSVVIFLGGAKNLTPSIISIKGDPKAHFGFSLAAAGDVNGDGYADLLVGNKDNVAYLFLGSKEGIQKQPANTLHGPTNGQFAAKLAGVGDVNGDGFADVIIGDPGFGKAYFYKGSKAGLAGEPTVIPNPWGRGGDFTWSAASAGDLDKDGYGDVIIGERSNNRAYLYFGSKSGLSNEPVVLDGPKGSWEFGYSVARAGDVRKSGDSDLIIGADASGSAYLLPGATAAAMKGSPGGLKVLLKDPVEVTTQEGARAAGGALAGLADFRGDGKAESVVCSPKEGTVSIYACAGAGFESKPLKVLKGPSGSHFGLSAAIADVNGDGLDDLLVGSDSSGCVWLYLGDRDSTLAEQPLVLKSPKGAPCFGRCLANAGDVNGDGLSDILVGENCTGNAYLYLGSRSGFANQEPRAITVADGAKQYFGRYLAGIGDVNGDGYADVAIESTNGSVAYVFYGSKQGLVGAPQLVGTPNGADARELNCMGIGDVNGDGIDDALLYDSFKHTAYVHYGSRAGLSAQGSPLARPGDSGFSSGYGFCKSAAGIDLNGDGIADLLVGYDLLNCVCVYWGSKAGISADPVLIDGPFTGLGFGRSIFGMPGKGGLRDRRVAIGAESTSYLCTYTPKDKEAQ
jgi:hypothetical protein